MTYSFLFSRYRTLILAVVCFGGAFISGYLLYLDLEDVGSAAGTGKILAHVEQAVSSVKRRSASSFLWSNVEPGTALFRKDSVQVGVASQAIIRLKDDSLLEIGERSLVIIEDVPPLEMKFLKGNFIVRGREQDYRIAVEENQAPVIEPIPIRLLSPSPNETFYLVDKGQQLINFRWSPLDNANKGGRNIAPVLEISSSNKFIKRQTQTVPLDNNRNQAFSMPFAEGDYFWRVRAENLTVFETRSFSVAKPIRPELLSPIGGKQVFRWEALAPIEFTWITPTKPHQIATWIELGLSPKFEKTSLLTRQEVALADGKVEIQNVAPGKYYWRLLQEYPGKVITSDVETFSLERNTNVNLSLLEPKSQARLAHQKPVTFSWAFPADAMEYQFEVQRVENNTGTPVYQQVVNDRQLPWTATQPGQYRWRVGVIWKKEIVKSTSWQEFFVFDDYPVVLLSPNQRQAFQYWKTPPEFALEWTPQDVASQGKNRYRLMIATDPNMVQNQKVFRTRDTRISRRTLKLGNGRYFWQVQVVDSQDRPLKSSAIQDFQVKNFDVLAAPEKVNLSPGEVINLITSEKDPVARWAPVPDAQAYEVVVKQGGRTLASERTEKPEFPLKDLKPGKYTWTARAIDPLDRPGVWLKERTFTLSFGKRLRAPQIIGSKVE